MSEVPIEATPVTVRLNDATRMFGIGRTSLYELIKEGHLSDVIVAGRRLVKVAELERLVEQGTASSSKREF